MATTKVCALADVEGREALDVVVAGLPPLAVWNVEGRIFVTDDTCTHGQASLVHDGTLDGFEIECGLHLGAFDVRTGKVTSAPCFVPLKVYDVVIEDEWVCISG